LNPIDISGDAFSRAAIQQGVGDKDFIQEDAAVRTNAERMSQYSKRVVGNPFTELGLERAIGLRWTLRDIQPVG
jgi:hypothetical protein